MSTKKDHRTFYYKGDPVGCFTSEEMPQVPGTYEYVPYRGPGHYRLGTALTKDGPQQCHFEVRDKKCSFTVVRVIPYGKLELTDVQQGS